MKKYSAIIFDLDGTLTEPQEGILNSVRHALKHFNIEEEDSEKLKQFIGPPLTESFRLYYHLSAEEALKAVDVYREYFSAKGIYENEIFPGIPELLQQLIKNGCTLFVGTSKPTIFANQILDHFKIGGYFKDIVGSNMDLTRVSKYEIIGHILQSHGLTKSNVLMIGDTRFDIEGAHACEIDSAAVMYGHGTRTSIETAGPTYFVDDVGGLAGFLDSHT